MPTPTGDPSSARHSATILVLSLLALAAHLAVNALGGYGYFRDELYYLACGQRLAAGYVDQPPLVVFVMAGSRLVFGESVFAVRLLPAAASALSVMLLCLIARRMGGGRPAMVLGALAYLAAPHIMAFDTYASMNSLDIVFWLLAAYLVVRLVDRPDLPGWLLLGLALGLGLLNKTSVLWLGAGLFLGILLTPLRRQLATPGPWAAGLVALVVFSPFVVWNLQHDLAHLEFMKNAAGEKYASLTRLRFLADLFRGMNPFTFLVSLPGLAWCLVDREGRRFRALGIAIAAVFAILLANPHTKSEYAAAACAVLFACGGVAIERRAGAWRRVVVPAAAAVLAISGAVVAPLAMPILPVETYLRYARALGVAPVTAEGKDLAELGQFFADMHGWEELAQHVSVAFLTIPESERRTTVAFVHNYGEAAALELYASRYPVPRVICNHNSYWLWGVGTAEITTFIRLGGTREDYLESYADVSPAGVHQCRYCMPYENDLAIFVARRRLVPIADQWSEYRHYE
jgi:4-amino-4-deoxy-L-arabinose transferase-like glycosyltransferase